MMINTVEEQACTEQLARFFPKLPAARIGVRVSSRRSGQARAQETTLLEFASEEFGIFLCRLALEFDDRVELVREGGGRPVEAAVIALQYQAGSKAVAVRFLNGPCDWMNNR